MHYTCKRQPPCRGYLNTGTSEWQRLKLKLHRKYHQKQQKYLPTVFTSVSVQLPPLFSHTSHFNLQRDPNSTHKHKCGAWCALRANWRNASSEQYLRCMRNSWLLEPNLFFLERHNTAVWKHTLDPTAMTPTSARLTDTFVCHQLPYTSGWELGCWCLMFDVWVWCELRGFVRCVLCLCFAYCVESCYISIRDIDSRRRIVHCSND